MTYRYGFGDEAGETGGSQARAASTHFVTALLLTNDPEGVRDSVRQFRSEKRIRDDSEVSFYASPDANRISFLDGLLAVGFAVRAVVVDKRTLNGGSRRRGLSLYTRCWTMLFKWLAQGELDRASICLHEFGGPATTIPTLTRRLRQEVGIHIPSPCLVEPIRATRPIAQRGLEAADMVTSAIFRMVEHGDARFHQPIRPRAQVWRPAENENPPS